MSYQDPTIPLTEESAKAADKSGAPPVIYNHALFSRVYNLEQSVSGPARNTVTWAPFATLAEAIATGKHTVWADAVAAINKLNAPVTFLQIEANPWDDEVVIPAGKWTLNNTVIVGKAGYAQGGRDWYASQDYGNQGLNQGWQYYSQQYRGHQVKLWVHPEYSNLNPCKIYGCVGLKDVFFRGQDLNSSISGTDATYFGYEENPYNPSTGTCYIRVSGNGDTFSDADLWKQILNVTQDWYVTVLEVISPTLIKVDTEGNPNWLIDAPNGTVSNQEWETHNDGEGVLFVRNNSTFDLIGRMGGKESYFSNFNSSTNTSRLYTRGVTHGEPPPPSSSDNYFDVSLTGKKISVSNIGDYSGEYTVLHVWSNDEVEIDLPVDLTGTYGSGNKTVNWSTLPSYHTDTFVLDNVDFRSAYDNYGTLNVRCGNLFVKLTGAETSIRSGQSITTEGLLVVQSDGSPAWIGSDAIGSYDNNGYLKIYALPGMSLNTGWFTGGWSIDFDLYQGSVPYIPDNESNWNSTPYNLKNALDELAQRLRTLEGA